MIGDKPSDRIAYSGFRSVILKSRYTENDPLGYDITTLKEAELCLEDF